MVSLFVLISAIHCWLDSHTYYFGLLSARHISHNHDPGTAVTTLRPDIRIDLRGTAAVAAVAGVVRFGPAIDNQREIPGPDFACPTGGIGACRDAVLENGRTSRAASSWRRSIRGLSNTSGAASARSVAATGSPAVVTLSRRTRDSGALCRAVGTAAAGPAIGCDQRPGRRTSAEAAAARPEHIFTLEGQE